MRPTSPALLYVGLAVAGAGFALIAVTWGRVAGLESVALQLPYLVSGGFTGLGLVIVGSVAVNIHAKQREGAERERQTEQLLEIVHQVSSLGGMSPDAPKDVDSQDGNDGTEELAWQR